MLRLRMLMKPIRDEQSYAFYVINPQPLVLSPAAATKCNATEEKWILPLRVETGTRKCVSRIYKF